MDTDQVLLTSSQTAKIIGVTIRTWYVYDQLGKVPKPVRIGRKLFWHKDELYAWINSGCPKRDDWNYKPKKNV